MTDNTNNAVKGAAQVASTATIPAMDDAELQRLEQIVDDIHWVETDSQLAELCLLWRQQPTLGLDTEFIRTDTFYPIPGLIQVASDGHCYLLDPTSINDFSPFAALLRDPAVIKVLHACSEDLELFAHSYGAVPTPLFDTQVACAFVGMGLSIGYQRLLNDLYGVELNKEETRSDWLQRPLTESQKRYAALDVVYLDALYRQLSTQLQAEGKYSWVLEECAGQAEAALQHEDYQLSYLQRFKQGWKLAPKQLAVLQALSAWREDEARKCDVPRNFLLHNHAIMAIAGKPPQTLKALGQVERMRHRTVGRYGRELLALIETAMALNEADCPPPPPRPLPPGVSKMVKQLKQQVSVTADRLTLAPELLVRRKDLEQLLRSGMMPGGDYQLPEGLHGWRKAVIGDALLKRLRTLQSQPDKSDTD